VIAVDTGLGHLAAALSKPTLSLYGPTNPGLCGTFGHQQIHMKAAHQPETVWAQFEKLLRMNGSP